MRYAQLRAFHNVALHLGFSSAAKAMDMTQPALSDQVRKLEQTYDVLLFDRTRRQIQLTTVGEQLFNHTRRLFECEGMAEEFLTQTRSDKNGVLTIVSDSPYHYGPALAAFRAEYPEIKFNIRQGSSDEIVSALRDYHADIGFVGMRPKGGDFQQVPLSTSKIIAFVSQESPVGRDGSVSIEELSDSPLVLRESGSRTREGVEAMFTASDIAMNVLAEAEGREASREIVAAGGSVGFASEAEFGHDPRLRKIQIKNANATLEENLICLADRSRNTLISAFMEVAAAN